LVIEGDGPSPTAPVKQACRVASSPQRQRDTKLITLLAEAHAARKLVLAHPNTSLADLAKQHALLSEC
jgi:hypothetical protein